jgi:hypothetical protein
MAHNYADFVGRAFDWDHERRQYRRVLIQLIIQDPGSTLKVNPARAQYAQELADDPDIVLLLGEEEITIDNRKRLAALTENGEYT